VFCILFWIVYFLRVNIDELQSTNEIVTAMKGSKHSGGGVRNI